MSKGDQKHSVTLTAFVLWLWGTLRTSDLVASLSLRFAAAFFAFSAAASLMAWSSRALGVGFDVRDVLSGIFDST
jgi:hypothetical protein